MVRVMNWRRDFRWDPTNLAWRVAILFMVGSFFFALGSFPAYAQNVDGSIVGITFVVGSIFFTSAAYSQFLQTINATDDGSPIEGPFRYWAFQTDRILWWATVVQLGGTLFFNANTIDAMVSSFSTTQVDRLVWTPDFYGSICFLAASHLAWQFACGRFFAIKMEDRDWWVALFNYVGSIAFMISAIASFVVRSSGEAFNVSLVNSGTFYGAVCFFVGGLLLLPEAERARHT